MIYYLTAFRPTGT